MKVVERSGTVERSSDVTSQSFRIKASRKAFEILSAGIYSDRIRAIVRELSTNAADAHVAAGKKDVPFEIHLPNNLEPHFSVTDYGTGLSDEAMRTIYTTYFESDKTDSNDFTGCLGLGSKSPFSYTDSFVVESRFNGVKRIYNAYLTEESFPAIAKLGEEPTTEPNGLTVQFPVKSGDFYSFRDRAAMVLRWFEVRPVVKGWNLELPEPNEFLRKTERYGVYESRENASYVVMGNVAYPIHSSEFLTSEDNKLRALVDWGVELYVNVGDVDISASREKLGYDKRTVKFLKGALQEALADMEKEVTKDISGKKTLWEAREALHKLRRSFNGFDFKGEWGGKKIEPYVHVGFQEVEIPDENGKKVKVTRRVARTEVLRVKSYSHNERTTIKKETNLEKIHADGTKIYLNDSRGAYAAVRRQLQGKDYGYSVLLLSDPDQQWLMETGLKDVVIKTSSLPKAPRAAPGTRGTSQKAKVYEFVYDGNSGNGGTNAASYWKPAEIEVDDGGVYVEILYFNYRMQDGEATVHPQYLRQVQDILAAFDKKVPIYGIRPSDKELFDESDGEWFTVKEYMKSVAEEMEPIYDQTRIEAEEFANVFGHIRHMRFPIDLFVKKQFAKDSVFGKYVVKGMEARKAAESEKLKPYNSLLAWLRLEKKEGKSELQELQDKVYERYPLIQHLSYDSYHSSRIVEAISSYVNMIDREEEVSAANAA